MLRLAGRKNESGIIDGAGGAVEYEWDHRNRLVKVSFYDDQAALEKEIEYRYDAFDRRIAKLLDSDGDQTVDSEEHYVYDGDDIVLQYDDASSLTHRYLHGPAVDQILADEDDLGDVLWPLADNQGIVRDLIDGARKGGKERGQATFPREENRGIRFPASPPLVHGERKYPL